MESKTVIVHCINRREHPYNNTLATIILTLASMISFISKPSSTLMVIPAPWCMTGPAEFVFLLNIFLFVGNNHWIIKTTYSLETTNWNFSFCNYMDHSLNLLIILSCANINISYPPRMKDLISHKACWLEIYATKI